MKFGIFWELSPDKVGEVMAGYENNKFQTPEGLKIIGKWLYDGTKCIEIVEAENPTVVAEYTGQFDEYGSYEVVELTDAREAIKGLVF